MRDIRAYKQALRQRYRDYRTALTPEQQRQMNDRILQRVQRLSYYRQCSRLLAYVSTPIEVDTRRLIEAALAAGKQVAVPRCVPGTRQMEFYTIDSLRTLSPGMFGVLEPKPDPARLIVPNEHDLCIVPGLCFDHFGFRLGYGKGYYDRFLTDFTGRAVGVCYAACVRYSLFRGRYDRPVDLLVTERYVRRPSPLSPKAKIQTVGEGACHAGKPKSE